MEQHFNYKSSIQEIPTIREDLSQLKTEWAIPNSEMRQLTLIIEEIFSNIIRFAYTDTEEHAVSVRLGKDQEEIFILIKDDGIPFNPLEYNPGISTDPASSLDAGMGLMLIRTFSNSITYERVNGHNQLLIVKTIKSGT